MTIILVEKGKDKMETIYLKGQWEGWIINPLQDGLQIIGPGCSELEIEQDNYNTVSIRETQNISIGDKGKNL